MSVLERIPGEKVSPSLLDRYLARTGVESQLTARRPREGTLFEPPVAAGVIGSSR